jgi:hypothetical protein
MLNNKCHLMFGFWDTRHHQMGLDNKALHPDKVKKNTTWGTEVTKFIHLVFMTVCLSNL